MIIRSSDTLCRAASALALLALVTLGTSCSHDVPTAARVAPTPNPPAPSSPAGVVDLFQWSMNNRDLPHFQELFTSDFQFAFAAADTAAFHFGTLSRDEMLIAAHHLFAGGSATEPPARSISLIFDGNLPAVPDLRPGMLAGWHQAVQVPSLTLTINATDGSAIRIAGGLMFYVVRGDSAAVPPDLIDRGIKPDGTRWFIGRMEDGTGMGAAPGAVAAPAATLPSHKMTLGRLLLLYGQ
jgi:hypothetical protein